MLRLLYDDVHEWVAPIVYSGEHRMLTVHTASPGKAISFALLTRGPGASQSFRAELQYYTQISLAVTHDADWVMSLLRPLSQADDQSLRDEANGLIRAVQSRSWKEWGGPCPVRPDTTVSQLYPPQGGS